MRKYTKRMVEVDILVECRCDDCGTLLDKDSIEAQEMVPLTITGGYGSLFGDDVTVTTDLCQHCLLKRLGDVLHLTFAEGGTEPCLLCQLEAVNPERDFALVHTCGKPHCSSCDASLYVENALEPGYRCTKVQNKVLPPATRDDEAPAWCPKRETTGEKT